MHIKKTISLNHEAWMKVRVERERERERELCMTERDWNGWILKETINLLVTYLMAGLDFIRWSILVFSVCGA